MKSSQHNQPSTETPNTAVKKRFEIQRLEERIAPKNCHFNPQDKWVGCPKRSYYYDPCYFDPSCW